MRAFTSLCVFVLLSACGGSDPVEQCDDGLDNDFDLLIDCADDDCIGSCPELCADMVDNDGDGLTDCYDDDCDGVCNEVCDDGRDNDGDGDADCEDTECFSDSCVEICGDQYDNDADGGIDCGDADCAGPECAEACYDGVDNDADGLLDCADDDCDGQCPEDCDDGRDNDGDGVADCEDRDCDGDCPEDCSDARDNDADGLLDCFDDECFDVCDFDRDGYLAVSVGGDDCDDMNANVNPGQLEVCNFGIDDNCNGYADDLDAGVDPTTQGVYYVDNDGDGFGQPGSQSERCAGENSASTGGDCVDGNAAINPGATEICDGLDNDCDSLTDDDDPGVDESTASTWYLDSDGDGWGAGEGIDTCTPPTGHVEDNTDCDDSDREVFGPGLWVTDGDGDGYGAGDTTGPASCTPPAANLVSEYLPEDCEDGDASIYPTALEVCEDEIDQDCDGEDLPCITYLYTINTSTDQLQAISLATGVIETIGPIGFDLQFGDLAFDRASGNMYLIEARPNRRLHSINTSTGAATLLGEHGVEDLFGAGYHIPSGTLYASGETPRGWYRMNTSTATAVFLGEPDASLTDIAWDPIRETFVGYEGLSGKLYSISLGTGDTTLIANLTFINNGGIEVDPLTGDYYIIDLSGKFYRVQPDADYTRTEIMSGIGAHDGLTVGPPR